MPLSKKPTLTQYLIEQRRRYPQAEEAYRALRTFHDPALVRNWMVAQGILSANGLSVHPGVPP